MIWINAIAVLAHIALGVYILKRYPRYVVFFGYLFLIQTWSLVSCFYNDTGIYNFELLRDTETTLATTRLSLFLLVFNGGLFTVIRLLDRRRLPRYDYSVTRQGLNLGSVKFGVLLTAAVLVGYVAYTFATDGIPIMQGLHKVLFLQEAGVLERTIVSYCWLFGFVLGYYRRKGRLLSLSNVLLVLLLLYLVAVGNKFSAFMRVLAPYFAAVLVTRLKNEPDFTIFRLRYLVVGGVVVVGLVFAALASYTFWGQGAGEGAAGLVTDRILALQGHLWWVTDYNLFVKGAFDPSHWQSELAALLSSSVPEGSVGMKYVMIQAIGPHAAYLVFDTGYLYTMAYPAILVLTFPYPVALLVQFSAGMFLAVALWYFHACVQYRHFLRSVITITIVMTLLGVLSTGDLADFLTGGLLFKIVILTAFETGLLGALSVHRGAEPATPESAPVTSVGAGD